MQLYLLHLDDALLSQADFVERCMAQGAQAIDAQEEGSYVRLWGKHPELEALTKRLHTGFTNAGDEPKLCFMGSGDFHHVTSLLLSTTLDTQAEPITLIHFDNHPDWVHFAGGAHCGSWVNRAAAHPAVAKIITVGVASNDLSNPDWKGANLQLLSDGMLELYPYSRKTSTLRRGNASFPAREIAWQPMDSFHEEAFIDTMMSRIHTRNIYITIDKDVLVREDAYTNWDQGHMRLDYLLRIVRALGTKFRIVGADVNGDYSTPRYSGSICTRAMKHAEIFLDQPRTRVDGESATRINSNGNHALLTLLQEVMA